jgi:type II secretory pathway pseudopilin PulG
MRRSANTTGHRGHGLLEVVVALGLLAVLLASLAPVTTATSRAVARARLQTRASAAAVSQLERLRALPWYHVPGGTLVVDGISLVGDAGFVHGGPGLASGPLDALETSTAGYEDHPGDLGLTLTPDVGLTRRWRIVPLASDSACVVLVVEVAAAQALAGGQSMEDAALARAQTVRCAAGARP